MGDGRLYRPASSAAASTAVLGRFLEKHMTREDIKEMAMTYGYSNLEDAVDLALAVAKIATEYEREACADLCERHAAEPLIVRTTKISDRPFSGAALDCAELVRARPGALAQADAACGVSPGAMGSAAHYGGRNETD